MDYENASSSNYFMLLSDLTRLAEFPTLLPWLCSRPGQKPLAGQGEESRLPAGREDTKWPLKVFSLGWARREKKHAAHIA